MRKLNPNIIRVGDRVKIINPVFVTRCGYPLCVEDMKKEVCERFGKEIKKLIYSVQQNDNKIISNPYEINEKESRDYQSIIRTLAHVRLKAKNYGGNERTLHTKIVENLKGKEVVVVSTKIVQTGTYNPSSGGYDSYSGEYDYVPAYLTNVKTHKILQLEMLGGYIGDWVEMFGYYKIEAINVVKVPSIMETAIEYEHRIKQMEKT